MSERLSRIQNWEGLARESRFRPGVMAAKCPVSLRQLERYFAERFSKTPRAWAKDLQLSIALDLISQGWSNKAVVEELGFANRSHFCREFKKYYGVPPQTRAPLYQSRPATRPYPSSQTGNRNQRGEPRKRDVSLPNSSIDRGW